MKGQLREASEQFRAFIALEEMPHRDLFLKLFKGKLHYNDFLNEAVDLAVVYIRAAYELYRTPRVDDSLREAFRDVVANADLGFPLELHILQTATENLPKLVQCVEAIRSRWHLDGQNE